MICKFNTGSAIKYDHHSAHATVDFTKLTQAMTKTELEELIALAKDQLEEINAWLAERA